MDKAFVEGSVIVHCTGRDGVTRPFHYEYHFDELDNVWHFFIYADSRPASNEMFDMTFTPINETTVRQTSIFHHHEPAYMGIGIPDAMLPVVKAILGKGVESSPPKGEEGGVFRSRDAEKMWRRLVEKGLAEYDSARRVYRVKCPGQRLSEGMGQGSGEGTSSVSTPHALMPVRENKKG